jgi:DNA repair protein RecO (recombination protein O)
MKWQDKGIIVSIKKYGESSLILNLLTENHGLHSGLVRNSISKKIEIPTKLEIYVV